MDIYVTRRTWFGNTKHGFVASVFGFEFSYAHFDENIGIMWTRRIAIGNWSWFLTEGWKRVATRDWKGFRYNFDS